MTILTTLSMLTKKDKKDKKDLIGQPDNQTLQNESDDSDNLMITLTREQAQEIEQELVGLRQSFSQHQQLAQQHQEESFRISGIIIYNQRLLDASKTEKSDLVIVGDKNGPAAE